MQQKTITVAIDQNGDSSVDLEGFAGQGCEKAFQGLSRRGSGETTTQEGGILQPNQ